MPHDATEPDVRRVTPDFVGASLARFCVDPAQERLEADLIVRIGEKVDQEGHAAAWFLRMSVNRIAFRLSVALERSNRVAHVRRLDEFPIQVRRIAPDRELEAIGESLPEIGERCVETADWLHVGA